MNTATAEKKASAPGGKSKSDAAPVVAEPPKPLLSQRFVSDVERQFEGTLGRQIQWTDLQSTLAQNLFVKIDTAFAAFQAKGTDVNWSNINRAKLAIDARQLVLMEVDASEKNGVHVIPYFNSKTKVYDIDLRLGYVGYLKARIRFSKYPIADVVTKLVYETDQFTAYYKGRTNPIEAYDYVRTRPFDPGKPVGGFGYIAYEDENRNKLVEVTKRDFERSRKAGNRDFWGWDEYEDSGTGRMVPADEKHRIEMMEKTVIFRTGEQIEIDTNRIYIREVFEWAAVSTIEGAEASIAQDAALNANTQILETPAIAPAATAVSEPEPQASTPKPPADEALTDAQIRDLAKAKGDMTYKDNAGQTRVTATGNITEDPQPALGGDDY